MEKSVPVEVANRYIEGYFKKRYQVDVSRQPHFWDAVRKLSANVDADVSSLIDEQADYCLISDFGYVCVKNIETDITTVSDLARKIATEIIEEENKTVLPVELFILNKKMEEIEKSVTCLKERIYFNYY